MSFTKLIIAFVLVLSVFWQDSSCGKSSKEKPPSNASPSVAPSVANNNSVTKPPAQGRAMTVGTWGGNGLTMEVTESGATLEFDCAHARIGEKIVLSSSGEFSVDGVFVLEAGGPIRLGQEPKEQPANFSGTSEGEKARLTVKLAANDDAIGTYELTLGKQGRLRKCK